jgi:hypothetical protein
MALVGIGLGMFVPGIYLETRRLKTIEQETLARWMLTISTSLIGAGLSVPFARPIVVLAIAIVSPSIAFAMAAVAFWTLLLLLT